MQDGSLLALCRQQQQQQPQQQRSKGQWAHDRYGQPAEAEGADSPPAGFFGVPSYPAAELDEPPPGWPPVQPAADGSASSSSSSRQQPSANGTERANGHHLSAAAPHWSPGAAGSAPHMSWADVTDEVGLLPAARCCQLIPRRRCTASAALST